MRTLPMLVLSVLSMLGCGGKPIDTGADTGADTRGQADADTDADLTNPRSNPGFENGQDGSWLVYPDDLTNLTVVATGDSLHSSKDTFTAPEGSQSLKVCSTYFGGEFETPIYQQLVAGKAGTQYTFTGLDWHEADDPLTATHTYSHLPIKHFDDSYTFYDSDDSDRRSPDNSTSGWTERSVVETVPKVATVVQAALEWWECIRDTSGACSDGTGAVYYDDLIVLPGHRVASTTSPDSNFCPFFRALRCR